MNIPLIRAIRRPARWKGRTNPEGRYGADAAVHAALGAYLLRSVR